MVVVTGATGHLGNVLVRELLSRKETVKVVIPPGEDTTPLDGMAVEKVTGNVLDMDSLVRAFEGADFVYHMAGILFTSPRKTKRFYEVNLEGTRNVAEACLKCGVKRMIHTSSIQALAEPPRGTVIDESSPFDPARVIGDYAKSKARASLEVLSAVKRGLDAVILCPTGAIGPYDYKPSKMGQWFLDVATDKFDGRVYTINGVYDFVDVRDIAAAQIAAAHKGKKGEAYILSGEPIDQLKQTQIIQEASGARGRLYGIHVWQLKLIAATAWAYNWIMNTAPGVTLDEARIIASNSAISHEKAARELGFRPRPLKDSMFDAIAWFRQNGKL
jgi:dihydroflavonol-4-reductase